MKKLLLTIFAACASMVAMAQVVTAKWELSDKDNLSAVTMTGNEADINLVSASFVQGTNIGATATMSGTNADAGYTAVAYDPYFTTFTPKAKVTGKTSSHCITLSVTPQSGHTFKPTRITFDAAKVGTDGGNVDVYYKAGTGSETAIKTGLSPFRNKIGEGNSTGFTHYEYSLGDVIVDGKAFYIYLYIYNLNGTDNANPKAMGFRNVEIKGAVDEEIFTTASLVESFTCTGTQAAGQEGATIDLTELTKSLKNGGLASYPTKLYGDPTDFTLQLKEGFTSEVQYSGHVAVVKIFRDGEQVFYFEVMFTVTNREPKPAAKPLKRGLMALNLAASGGQGNLISWRARESDDRNVKYKLYRGSSATSQTSRVNSGKFITGKTNFVDAVGTVANYYRLEVYDGDGNLIETDVSRKTWDNQNWRIPLSTLPTDAVRGATYTPNDAAICDMDGDGEYEFILKWRPSNERDANSSSATSQAVYDCYKMDGTRLWRIQTGYNMFNSAHTTPFIAWDLDGDGYGEFMVKTAPGTIDGEGNYVLLGNDSPTVNLLSGRYKQDHGSEYITVFDGMTGAELSTIPYHTAYADATTSQWGDSNQNRSERYLAAIAWLDGPDKNPSPIFARGYYSSAFVGAYDFDGVQLKQRWLHRALTRTSGTVNYADGTVKNLTKTVYGEGAHWISVADVNGDGKQEIIYGAGALNPDGTTLYRTGFEHGDALHTGDFIPSRPGLESFMSLEHNPFGAFLIDASKGDVIWRVTAGSDTGRGLMAHFDPEAEDAYWQTSADYSKIYDTQQNLISSSISHGGGAALNNRLYWDGDLADEYHDKSILENWNVGGKYFERIQVNGGSYTIGNQNNDSKYNPCLLADVLGDWREEIVNWEVTDGQYYLVFNATNYTTDYTLPHLMDDLSYRAQVINQNCAYNQPPHLSYDPITRRTIEREMLPADVLEGGRTVTKYWDSFYTTYPVRIPEGVRVWAVSNYAHHECDTLKLSLLTGAAIPANRGVVVCSESPTVNWRPTTLATSTVSSLYLMGSYCDSTVVCNEEALEYFFELRDGDKGIGYYKADGVKIEGGTSFLRIKASASDTRPLLDFYSLGTVAPSPVAISAVETTEEKADDAIYTLQGVKVKECTAPGIYIKNGKKIYVR